LFRNYYNYPITLGFTSYLGKVFAAIEFATRVLHSSGTRKFEINA